MYMAQSIVYTDLVFERKKRARVCVGWGGVGRGHVYYRLNDTDPVSILIQQHPCQWLAFQSDSGRDLLSPFFIIVSNPC